MAAGRLTGPIDELDDLTAPPLLRAVLALSARGRRGRAAW
jgi:hypothetical protein